MRPLIVGTFLTLDGVYQAPGGPEEDPSGGFTEGGWSVNYWDDVMAHIMDESMAVPFDLLLGRRTYEIFAAHWPHAGEGSVQPAPEPLVETHDDAAQKLNGARKYVASRTLDRVEWQNSTLLVGDVAEQVAKLKAQPGPEIQVHGSGNLVQTLIANGLVDRYRLWIFPVLVGRGKRLFADGTPPRGMRLIDSTTSTTGVIIATYEPAGAIQHGSFAFEQPTHAEIERRRKIAAE